MNNDFEMSEKNWPSLGAFFDDINGKPVLWNEVTHYTESNPKGSEDNRDEECTTINRISNLEYFQNFDKTQREKLAQLLILPAATPVYSEMDGNIYVRNYGERFPIRGGDWSNGGVSGMGALSLVVRRVCVPSLAGFRPAFIG
jgi:hypothetical protein